MSTRIMAECWSLKMTAAQKSVLISLADNSNDQGVCWPSISTICERTCLSERSVQQAIKWLESAGILSRKERSGRSTYYAVTPAAYAPPQDMHPRTTCTPPPQEVHPTPAPRAPITVIEPSKEPSKPIKRNRSGSSRLPDDFVLTDHRKNLAEEYWASKSRNDLSAEDQFARFVAHHRSKGSRMADWDAAWVTWYCNAVTFNKQPALSVVRHRQGQTRSFSEIDYSQGVTADGKF